MRTIDHVSSPIPIEPAPHAQSRVGAALKRLASIIRRLFARGTNSVADLSAQQRRDIGIVDGDDRMRNLDWAVRQDELLREVHAKALLLSRNIGGR